MNGVKNCSTLERDYNSIQHNSMVIDGGDMGI